jgi:hypothetical protein
MLTKERAVLVARPASRAWALSAILVGLYAASVALLFASRVREFADETDNLLGGLVLTRGYRLYVDFFSSHMPLGYFVAAVPALMGATSLEEFRLFSNTLLVLATVGVVWGFRRAVPLVILGGWAIITVFAHTLQWGEMLTASTCAGYGLLVAGLLFYTTPSLNFSRRQQLALSAAMFLAVQSELVAILALLPLIASYVGVRIAAARQTSFAQQARTAAVLLLIVLAPQALLLFGLWLAGELPDFIYYAYQFNQIYYSQFVMNSSVLGMLHDWEAQYRTYLAQSLQDPASAQGCLVLGNVLAACIVARSRGLLVATVGYLFIALTHVRDEGAYYLCSYFCLALDLAWAFDALRVRRNPWQFGASALVLLLGGVFAVQVGLTYDLSDRPARIEPDVAVVEALTEPGARVFVAPFDPYVYLTSGRMPASVFPYYFPWHAADPRVEARLRADLHAARPPVVIFRGDELVNGHWLPKEYGKDLYDFLLSEGYAPLDDSPSLLGDVLVPEDRLVAARESLASNQPFQAAAAEQQQAGVQHESVP